MSDNIQPRKVTNIGRFLAIMPILLVMAFDQMSKYAILNIVRLQDIGQIKITGFFNLTMVWNYGVSFGALRADSPIGRWGLVGLSLGISVLFLYWLFKSDRKITIFALGLVIGGALGNVIDRIRFGAVADFLDFSGLYFPWVFNIADAGVVIGAAILLIEMVFTPENDKNLKNNDV